MKIVCFHDGWDMIPKEVLIRGCDIDVRYYCPHCDASITIVHTYPVGEPFSIIIDEDHKKFIKYI